MKHSKDTRKRSLMFTTLALLYSLLLPFSILSFFFSIRTMNTLRTSTKTTISTTIDASISQIETKITTSNYILATLFQNNDSFYKYLNGTGDWHDTLYKYDIIHIMNVAIDNSSSCDALFLYLPSRDELALADYFRYVNGVTVGHLSKEEIREILSDTSLANGKWNIYDTVDTQYLIRIQNSGDYQMGTYINLTALMPSIKASLDQYEATFQFTDMIQDVASGHQQFVERISPSQTYLCAQISFFHTYRSAILGFLGCIALFILSIVVIPVYSYSFRRHFNHPLQILGQAFHELENGNETYRITEEATSSEFEDTFHSFNAMAENSMLLRHRALEEERTRHELSENYLNLQLENLQLQIRPHFLQNTMNLLFTLIQNHQEGKAKRLVLYLSKYFRYMFRYNHDLELFDKELDLIKEYLEIASFRNENAFSVSYQIDPLLSFLRLPPLLLHNFVENIIKHALIPDQTIHIIIYGEYDDDAKMAVIQISDDGRGIQEDFADRINRNDFDDLPPGQHIGIRNSIRRLNHYYTGASLKAESSEVGGTIITIKIPCNFSDDDTEL